MTSVELWWGYEQDSVRIPCSVFTSVELSCPECSVQEPCDVFRKLSHLHVLFPAPFLPDGRLLNPAHSKLAPPWSFVMSSDSPPPPASPVNFPDILSRAQGHPAAFPGQALRYHRRVPWPFLPRSGTRLPDRKQRASSVHPRTCPESHCLSRRTHWVVSRTPLQTQSHPHPPSREEGGSLTRVGGLGEKS